MFFDRAPAALAKRPQSATRMFPAPNRGWIRNESMVAPKAGGAEVLDNWFPTPEGARMRKGSTLHGTIADAVMHLAVYDDGGTPKMFAADEENIYNATNPADPEVALTADVTGLSSGDWSSQQVTTSGGTFLVMVNGSDTMQQYTGSAWREVTDATVPAITAVDTDDLSHVWLFKNRLFFVEKGGLDAWYLGAGAVTGTATVFPLGGVFRRGGALLFGATWSLDSGDGLDDMCLFVTDQGEVAVYQGTDPASADTFALVGVYQIGRPLHKNGHFKAGGDIAVLTDDGIVPISAAVKGTDRAALSGKAITYPIESAWRLLVSERGGSSVPFTATLWHSETMLLIGLPVTGSFSTICLVCNARTGAWGRFTGWDVRCSAVFNDRLYFGTGDGTIVRGEVSGADQGVPYTATFLPRFDLLGTPAEKVALLGRIVARANNAFTPQLFANADYQVDIPTVPQSDSDTDTNLWDTGIWDQSEWGVPTDIKAKRSEWQSVGANGHALSLGLQITSGRTTAPDVELIALYLQYEAGDVMGSG